MPILDLLSSILVLPCSSVVEILLDALRRKSLLGDDLRLQRLPTGVTAVG